jgi:signal peptidase II
LKNAKAEYIKVFKSKWTWIVIALLILGDQGIKLYINAHYLGTILPVLPPVIYFRPIFNTDYSWFASMLDLSLSKWLHAALVGILLVLILLFYRHLQNRLYKNNTVSVLFAFLFSGAFCSLLDKVFWNGSLDFVLIKGFFTFDTKDVYISLFVGLTLLFLVQKNKVFHEITENRLFNSFVHELTGNSKKQKQ